MSIDGRLSQLGIVLPPVFPPAGNYVGCVVIGTTLHVGGHGPVAREKVIRGIAVEIELTAELHG